MIRTLTGAIFGIVIIGSILLGSPTYGGLMSVFVIVGTLEFFRMFDSEKSLNIQKYYGIFISTFVYLLVYLIGERFIPVQWLLLLAPLFFISFIIEIYQKTENPIQNIALSLFPVFYIALPLSISSFITTLFGNGSTNILLGFFFLIWTNDSFAYLTGVSLGKHRLLERISPKKSWEGFFGGLIFSFGVGLIIGQFFQELTPFQWAVMAVIITLSGTYGDLAESMFKRSRHIKDSGKIFPGHGGVLDRFDGVILSAPFVALYLYFIL